MAEKDIIMKYLSHISPNQIVDFLGIQANGVQYLSEEIKDIRMTDLHADFVLETDEGEIIHVEFQQQMTRDTLNRFYVYNALLTRQFDKPVSTYVIYLGRSKIGEQIVKSKSVTFKPEIIRVYEMDAKVVLEKTKNGKANYMEMALMPLMKNSSEEKIIELVDNEAQMNIGRSIKNDVITATLAISGTIYSEEFVRTLKERVIKMFNVDIFEKERKEAIEKGRLEGEAKGKLENLREVVSKLLLNKFKEKYTKELKEKVKNGDMETLEYIADHIFDISLDEIKKIL